MYSQKRRIIEGAIGLLIYGSLVAMLLMKLWRHIQ